MRYRDLFTAFSIAILIPGTAVLAQPQEAWVDDDWLGCIPGDPVDGHVCGTDAFDSIQGAIDVVASPAQIYVAPGIYGENLRLEKDGLTITGSGSSVTVIDGGRNGSTIDIEGPSVAVTITDFTISNGSGEWIGSYTYGGGVLVRDATLTLTDSNLIGNRSSDGAGGLEARRSKVYLYDNRIIDNRGWWGGGITFRQVEGEIWRNVIELNACGYGGAVWLESSSIVSMHNNQVTRNTCGPPAIGIGLATNVTIVNNTIADNNGPGVATGIYDTNGDTGFATIYNTIVWGNSESLVNLTATYSNTDGTDAGEGNISADPLFVNPAGGDFSLVMGSPAIDTGTNSGAPATDLHEQLRPIDGNGDGVATVDMGAVELRGPFNDVPPLHWAVSFIERLADSGITAGCGDDIFCPGRPVTRAQMAVFLERCMHGSNYAPPAATGTVFIDVGADDFAASFIEQFHADGITAGCGNDHYCPNADVTRAQVAVFLLRAKHGSGYAPPAAAGVFDDVGLDHWAAAWIEQLAAEGITAGCGGGNYCPDAQVTRAQMAVFLVRAFGL